LLYSKLYFNSTVWNTQAYDISVTSDNHFLMAGLAYRTSATSRFSIIKLNDQGDTLWFRTDTDNAPWSLGQVVRELSNGNYVIGANLEHFIDKLYISIFDQNGNLLHQHIYGDTSVVPAHFLVATIFEQNGHLYFFCQKIIPGQHNSTVIVKTDLQGNLAGYFYDTTFAVGTEANSVILDGTNFVATGWVPDSMPIELDPVIVKLDSGLNLIWSARFPFPQNANARQVARTPDGGYVIIVLNPDYMIKTDSLGTEEWRRPLSFTNPSILTVGSRILISASQLWLYWYDLNGNPLDTVHIPLALSGYGADRTILKGDTLVFIHTVVSGQAPVYSSARLTLVRDSSLLSSLSYAEDNSEVLVYPTLIRENGSLYIKGLLKQPSSYNLYNIHGNYILKNIPIYFKDDGIHSIHIPDKLAKGIFILELFSENNKYTFKIVLI